MNFKEKSKIIHFLMGIFTLCIIFGAAFVGVYPVAAANHSDPAETNRPPVSEKKNRKTGTNIYDENLDSGGYLDDEDLDNKDWDIDWDDEALIESYAAFGIVKSGKSYYYQGELVNIIKDQRPDSSFYLLDINSKGTVSIKVIRNTEGEITGVSYVTEEEIAEILERAVGDTEH